jgi:hypothetical protein
MSGGFFRSIVDKENEIKDFEKDSFTISNMIRDDIPKLIHDQSKIQCTIVEKPELTTTDVRMNLN